MFDLSHSQRVSFVLSLQFVSSGSHSLISIYAQGTFSFVPQMHVLIITEARPPLSLLIPSLIKIIIIIKTVSIIVWVWFFFFFFFAVWLITFINIDYGTQGTSLIKKSNCYVITDTLKL